MALKRAEEFGRRQQYLKFLEQQMKVKQDQADFERAEKDRMRSQIKYRAENLQSQER